MGMNKYFRCKWIHENEDYPVQLISEIDSNRFEIRKIEVYSNGKYGFAYDDVEFNNTSLGTIPVPEFSEINENTEFALSEMTEEEFDFLWSTLVN